MNKDAIDLLLTRRSIRSFTNEQVSEEDLDKVLEIATYAPTGKGKQSPQLVVVRDKDTLDKLRKMNAEVMGVDKDPYYGAQIIVLSFAPNDTTTYIEDGTSVLVYMMLAAHANGLASVWIHRERQMFASPEGKELMKKWGIPENFDGIGALAIGYASGEHPDAAPRRDGYVIKV